MLPLALSEYLDFCHLSFSEGEAAFDPSGKVVLFDEVLERYLKFGGMSAVAGMDTTQEAHSVYMSALYDALLTRDIINRERNRGQSKVTDPVLLGKIADLLGDNIGNQLSIKSIADTLTEPIEICEYRSVCWVSAEGTTERDYLGMAVFKGSSVSVRFPKNTHPNRHNPATVLKRFEKALRENDFRAGDEAWLVVDVDDWSEDEFGELIAWEAADSRHHLAVSNPKFELFLLMHFEKGNGCTTPEKVDAALKKH